MKFFLLQGEASAGFHMKYLNISDYMSSEILVKYIYNFVIEVFIYIKVKYLG